MVLEILYFCLENLIPKGLTPVVKQLHMKEEKPIFFLLSLIISSKIRTIRFKGDKKFLLGEGRDLEPDVEREGIESPELAYHGVEDSNGNGNAAFLFSAGIGIFEDEKIAPVVFDLQGGLSSSHGWGLQSGATPPRKKLDVLKGHIKL